LNHPSNPPQVLTGHAGAVHAIAASADGALAISGGADYTMKVWDLSTLSEAHSFQSHIAPVRSVALDAAGQTALTGAADGWGALWRLGRAAPFRSFDQRLPDAQRAAAKAPVEHPDARSLATLGEWYAFIGQWSWAADLLATAREAGETNVSSLMLARCYWQIGKNAEARQQFERAIREHEAPESYLRICIRAIDEQK